MTHTQLTPQHAIALLTRGPVADETQRAIAQLIADLATQTQQDYLTGLLNYRTFLARLDQETARACRYKTPLSLLMIDLDRFKHLNDTYGHVVGNEALAAFGTLLRALRQADIPARYGGEEFVVIMPQTDLAAATVLAERLRQTVEAQAVQTLAGSLHITCSIGVAAYMAREEPQVLIARADGALRQAKRWRNCVQVAGSTESETLPAVAMARAEDTSGHALAAAMG